jgi:transcriptional regulator with XRE-family HTH domain
MQVSATNEMPTKTALRENLIRLRDERGWSQTELARRAKLGQSTVSRIEAGKRTDVGWDTITALARALGVDPVDLAGGQPGLVGEAPAVPRVRRIMAGDLLQPYLLSGHAEEDKPTGEELRWLAGLGWIMVDATLPLDVIAHALIDEHRHGGL